MGGANHPNTPNIRDIRSQDLADAGRLLELHRQAVKIGLAKPSEAGRLDFVALAQRARMSGKPSKNGDGSGGGGALFFWLLREKKTQFITLAVEDEARRMIKEHLYGTNTRQRDEDPHQQWGRGSRKGKKGRGEVVSDAPARPQYSKDERFVIACLRVAEKHRIGEPFRIAHSEGWSREKWDTTVEQYEATKFAIRQSELRIEDLD